MTVVRSTSAPLVTLLGGTSWTAEVSCVHADGSVTTETTEVHAYWGEEAGSSYVGDRFAGGTTISGQVRYRWAAQKL